MSEKERNELETQAETAGGGVEIPIEGPEDAESGRQAPEEKPAEEAKDGSALNDILEREIREKQEALERAEKEAAGDKAADLPPEPTPEEIEGRLKAEVEEWKGAYLRKQAEFQNFTKRKEKELDELRKFASEKIITKLLDGVDNLHRAMEASESAKDFEGLLKGVDMILTNLNGIMQSEGVEPIETVGKPYDPVYHHAVMVEDNPDFPDDAVIQELQKGYTMKGKVIRPAMVKVCKKG